jgi:transcriptional regulator
MYIPKYYREEDAEAIRSFMRQHAFATLVSHSRQQLQATHLPLELVTQPNGGEVLQGHVARRNPQWRDFESGQQVLAIFTGPHAFISASWYDHENVPTWNYQAVHVYGKVRLLEGEALLDALKRLVNHYEADTSIRVEGMSEDFLRSELRGLIGFEIQIEDLQAKAKLSQNRDEQNQQSIVSALEKTGDPLSQQVAEEMKRRMGMKKN